MTTVAVAIALYNGESFISEQLDSILRQTRVVDEVILCDDGSSDNTRTVVEEYIKNNGLQAKWKLYRNETNLGYIKNFYKAMDLTSADLIFLCDQDDIWNPEKIEIMTKTMDENVEISLLCCKHGIIDSNGNIMHSILERRSNETMYLKAISPFDLFRSYHWPGMSMCIRSSFYTSVKERVLKLDIAHDLALALVAAEKETFFEIDFIGNYHRRHSNNVAEEEHRIFKLLNLERKQQEINSYILMLEKIKNTNVFLNEELIGLLNYKLDCSYIRKASIERRDLKTLIRLYKQDKQKLLRATSFICDLWLVIFGKHLRK